MEHAPEVQALINDGSIEECPKCGALSAYAYQDSNISEAERGRVVGELDYNPELPLIYHIGACSGLGEWTCGKCDTPWMREDSPLNSPIFTHSDE